MSRPEDARCETCPMWATVERWAPIYDSNPGFGNRAIDVTVCKRFPDEVKKAADDWCGEHPAFRREEKE